MQVLPFDDNLCINEPCLNFEQCVSEQRFGNASSVVVGADSASVMFRPLHMSSTITCRCPVGFTGTHAMRSVVIRVTRLPAKIIWEPAASSLLLE